MLIITFFQLSIFAQDNSEYSVRIGSGYADRNDLGQIIIGDWREYDKDTYVHNIDAGWMFSRGGDDSIFDWYLKGGFSKFYENGYADDIYEATIYFKFYANFDFLNNRIRFGLGEGISIPQDIPIVEIDDAKDPRGNDRATAVILNYLDISLDFDLGKLIRVNSLKELYIGYTLKHRSGVYGLYSNVHGGSNYNMFTIEKNF